MKINTISVIGAGSMGAGIAQVFAMNGYRVNLIYSKEQHVKTANKAIKFSISKLFEKGKITDKQMHDATSLISFSDRMDEGDADLVFEAITEDVERKKALFKRLDAYTRRDVILATNTSTFSITEIAGATSKPENVIGTHFMNPVPVIDLVEIIRGLSTSDETTRTIVELLKGIGKIPVEAKDTPGFISNRIFSPMINNAICALEEGVGTKEDIDTVMKIGMKHPLGPLELADLVGLDVVLRVMESLHEQLGEKYLPCPLLRRMVAANQLGKKTGKGFYEY